VALTFVSQPASADILYDWSNIQTGTGNGFNGANTSATGGGSTLLGVTQTSPTPGQTMLSERFVLSSISTISSISFTGYSTSSGYPFPPTSPFTSASLSIYSAQPGTAGAAVLFTSNTLSMTAWTGIYRVGATDLTDRSRPVFTITMGFDNVLLSSGTYWAAWTVTGVVAPGAPGVSLSPPVMNPDGTSPIGTALRSFNGGATWTPVLDNVNRQINVPLTVTGTAIPEPSAVGLVLVAAAGFAVAAFRTRRRE
jgi:hypothetical protein